MNSGEWQMGDYGNQISSSKDIWSFKKKKADSGGFDYSALEEKAGVTSVEDIYLSPQEIGYLDKMERQRITALTDAINEEIFKAQQNQIADLVNRGVLNSDTGAEALAKIQDYGAKAIQRGTTDINTQRMADELAYLNQKRQYALQEDVLQWDMDKFIGGLQWRSYEAEQDRDLRDKTMSMYQDAANEANMWGLFGNVAGGALEIGLAAALF